MRKYEPIWNELKLYGTVSISASLDMHPRIIKAVRKEKWKDAGWRLLRLEEASSKYKLQEIIKEETITFKLIKLHPILSGL